MSGKSVLEELKREIEKLVVYNETESCGCEAENLEMAYNEGWESYFADSIGKLLVNPYDAGTRFYDKWNEGRDDATSRDKPHWL